MPTALALFLEEGGSALTPTRLHRETGVSRATIYRNWPEPADLIEIMLERATAPPACAFTGDLRSDLQLATDVLIDRFEHRPARAFFAACLEYGRTSDRLATAAEAFIHGILEPFVEVITAARSDGRLVGDTDEDLVSQLAGPLVLELLILGQPVSRTRGREMVDRFLAHNRAP